MGATQRDQQSRRNIGCEACSSWDCEVDAVAEAEPEVTEPDTEAEAEAEPALELEAVELEEPLAVHPSPDLMISMLSHEPVMSPNLYSQAGL